MISFSIFSILAVCAIAVFLRVRGTRLAYIWLLMFVITALVLILIVLANPSGVQSFSINEFFRAGNEVEAITFRLTNDNRLAGIGVFVLVLAFLATETASPQGDQSLYRWVETLAYSSAAWAALLSDNAWTVLISWTVLDVIDFASKIVYKQIRPGQFSIFYLSKLMGSMALVSVISQAYQRNPQNLLGGQIPNMGLWVFLAVFLHAGIFLNWQSSVSLQKNKKHTQLIQGLVFLSHFFLLTQVANAGIAPLLRMTLQVLMFGGALTMAYSWYAKKVDQLDFHHLIAALAFMGAFLFLSENQQGLTYFLLTLFPVSWIFLADYRSTQFTALWIVGILMLSGFPFTLQYAAFENLILHNRILESALMAIPSALIMAGTFRFLQKPSGDLNRLEKFNQAIYVLGLALPLVGIILALWAYRPAINPIYLWFGAVHIFLFVGFNYIAKRRRDLQLKFLKKSTILSRFPDLRTRAKIITTGIVEIAGAGLAYGARLLEEEGGILWAIVFLSLLLTILASMRGIT